MSSYNVRRKVFISFHQEDLHEVDQFIDRWATKGQVFIPKVLGVRNNNELIQSTNPQYVMSQIRQKYLGDSTVTIVLLGTCTHSRRYVDWELKTSLRQGDYTPNGVIGVILPSVGNRVNLPPRLKENWVSGSQACYARYHAAPQSHYELRDWIEDAHAARTQRAHSIQNSADMMKNNSKCKVCGVTH